MAEETPTLLQMGEPPPASAAFAGLSMTAKEKRDFAGELRKRTSACRLRREKFYARKSLDKDDLRTAADTFAADAGSISAAKRLLDTADPAWRNVTNILSRAGSYWKSTTTPYPEPGIRLIGNDRIPTFSAELERLRTELSAAVEALQAKYAELRERAREKLGQLFNEGDYPDDIRDAFGMDWDFPAIEPPAYLKDAHPDLYDREVKKIQGRFEDALRTTEQAMAAQLQELVGHLAERLTGGTDGKPKRFNESAIKNLTGFFDAFRTFDLGSNVQLAQLVDRAQDIIKGKGAEELRTNEQVRAAVAAQLAEVATAVDGLMVNKPNRAISFSEAA